jgi:hypothetical protein
MIKPTIKIVIARAVLGWRLIQLVTESTTDEIIFKNLSMHIFMHGL